MDTLRNTDSPRKWALTRSHLPSFHTLNTSDPVWFSFPCRDEKWKQEEFKAPVCGSVETAGWHKLLNGQTTAFSSLCKQKSISKGNKMEDSIWSHKQITWMSYNKQTWQETSKNKIKKIWNISCETKKVCSTSCVCGGIFFFQIKGHKLQMFPAILTKMPKREKENICTKKWTSSHMKQTLISIPVLTIR